MKYPEMYEELIGYLDDLRNKDYQIAVWVNKNFTSDVQFDELDNSIHFLFDDTQLATDPNSCIGWFLKNEIEAELVGILCLELDTIFKKYGTELTDEEYINLPEWKNVLDAADKAYRSMTKPEKQMP
ncbi:SCO4402 family protein [Endozoicomonas arenosclerae]|uniref:SCO4402 family protein n=1 Tax=Endozoicomonas arenosclerae TaxID=1633495 RepID=UPI0007807444|nr:hypothetical protein [Endozoicomonas arenosclerae]